jgi:hypothetical protein
MKLNICEAEAYSRGDEGYCTKCDEFTNGGVEPDAQNYECISCGENTVMGAELAITVLELIEITKERE